jgi:Tol biopolymer transport system component/DNA-binding winged helix-turn-helix (wHTH) protein
MSQVSLQPTNNVRFYDFGPFRVDVVNRLLLRDDEIVPLTAKVFDVLLVFVSSSGRMLFKDDLMKQIWPESFVEEGNLTRNVSTLRKALGESPKEHQYILTIPGRGYQFAARVTEVDDGGALLIEQHSLTRIVIEDELQNMSPPSVSRPDDTRHKEVRESHNLRRSILTIGLGGCLVASIVATVYLIRVRKTDQPPRFSQFALTGLTSNGDVYAPTISPDGKFLAYSSVGPDGPGLRVRQIATGSTVQVVGAGPGHYWGITFSRDSNYVYYVREESGTGMGALYRAPIVGGHERKLVPDVNGGPIMSPDGRRMAYGRIGPSGNNGFVADLDGKNEQKITPADPPFYVQSAAWSPDSKSITYVIRTQSSEGMSWYVAEIAVGGSEQRVILKPRKTKIIMIVWLNDYSGLIMNAVDPEKGVTQLSFVSYPSGQEQRITRDLHNYKEISVTSDGRTVVAQRISSLSQLWIAPEGDSDRARLVLTSASPAYHYLSWLPNNDLIFDAEENGINDIWKLTADGRVRDALTDDEGQNFSPATTNDGKYIVFVSTRGGSSQLWRMNADGNNPTQLTNSSTAIYEPKCTPDGKWALYKTHIDGAWRLLKTPIEGGSVTRVVEAPIEYWSVSPSGELLAYSNLNQESKTSKITIVRLNGGGPVRSFNVEPDRSIEWLKDGSGITYVGADNRNIWLQLLSGGAPRQLTHLKPDLELINFAWSKDGSQLAYTRGTGTFDAVALTFK